MFRSPGQRIVPLAISPITWGGVGLSNALNRQLGRALPVGRNLPSRRSRSSMPNRRHLAGGRLARATAARVGTCTAGTGQTWTLIWRITSTTWTISPISIAVTQSTVTRYGFCYVLTSKTTDSVERSISRGISVTVPQVRAEGMVWLAQLTRATPGSAAAPGQRIARQASGPHRIALVLHLGGAYSPVASFNH